MHLRTLKGCGFRQDTIKRWRIRRSTTDDLRDFSRKYNAVIRGWIECYGKFW
ncbi:group II intron maturase-specific domain-containing protein [Pseudomonas sp. TE36184]